MSSRPFHQAKIDELEVLVTDKSSTAQILRAVLSELKKRRANRRNITLIKTVESILVPAKVKNNPKIEKTRGSEVKPILVSTEKQEPQIETGKHSDGGALPDHLAEFVIALREEIGTAKRSAASSAYLLTEGKLVAPVGSGYHYRFQSQRRLRVPPDTPGEFRPGNDNKGINVIVVESRDLEVIIETSERLPTGGLQGKLITDLSMLLVKLIERIETKGVSRRPAADRILGFEPHSGERTLFEPLNKQLNEEQRDAVSAVLGQDTLFLWGPPGTGKTQTIGEIGAQLFKAGKTMLLVSHTNTAVDEALLRIAASVEGQFAEGDILRLGEPVKSELAARSDLILKRVAEKRSAELEAQKRQTEASRAAAMVELELIHRKVELLQWLEDVDRDLERFYSDLAAVREAEGQLTLASRKVEEFAADSDQFRQLANEAKSALDAEQRLQEMNQQIQAAKGRLAQAEINRKVSLDRLVKSQAVVIASESLEHLRTELKSMPTGVAVAAQLDQAEIQLGKAKNAEAVALSGLIAAKELLNRTSAVGAIKRMWQKLPKPEDQEAAVSVSQDLLDNARTLLQDVSKQKEQIQFTLDRIIRLNSELSPFAHVPALIEAKSAHNAASANLKVEATRLDSASKVLSVLLQKEEEFSGEIRIFVNQHRCSPADGMKKASEYLDGYEELSRQERGLKTQTASRLRNLKEIVTSLLSALREWGLIDSSAQEGAGIEAQLEIVAQARNKARHEVGQDKLASLEADRNRLSAHVATLIEEIRSIEESLKQVEEGLLVKVRVLATTLTRAFMRNGIQERMFDTVLVDEASMAPIPALWASATLAERCVVAVGDFKQLPPIVQSEHPLALRWLGRDVFKASGVQGAHERCETPRHFVALREQHRMHPQISALVNDLVYDGILRDGGSVTNCDADDQIKAWYSADIDVTPRISLIDTSGVAAWNTTSDKSRFNLLSAMAGMELAKSWLAEDRQTSSGDGKKRVLLIAPYRPQAKLLDIMVRSDGLDEEIMANTVHSFQGSEADAVIIDLVVDEPHFSANLMTPAVSEEMRRLLNVAITRSRRRLVIIADLEWFRAKGGGAFVGKLLLPWLRERHRPFELIKIMKSRLKDGGIMQAGDTLSVFLKASQNARNRVVIFSPTLDVEPVEKVIPLAIELQSRGINFIVVTRLASESRHTSQRHLSAEEALRIAGITIIHKPKMLEKLLLVDQSEVWTGSFAILEQAPESGFYIRRSDAKFAAELSDMLYINQVVDAYTPHHLCPVCGNEMTVADSREGKPFYWKCIQQGCYSRDMDAPAPVDGLLLLKCGGTPGFGYWGGVSHWLCNCGQKPPHRLKIHANHLKLPKMKLLIPLRSWAKVCRQLDVDPDAGRHDSPNK